MKSFRESRQLSRSSRAYQGRYFSHVQAQTGNSKGKENAAIPSPSQTQSHAQWKTGISTSQQGAVLGETPFPSAPRSIFECIFKKDQERMKNIAASRFAPFSTSNDLSPGPSLPTPPTKLLSTVFSLSWPIHLSRQEAWEDTRGISGLYTPAAQPEEETDSMDVAEEKPKEEVKEENPEGACCSTGHVWCYDARGLHVAACTAAVQALWRQGPGSGVLVDTLGSLADEFAGASAGATQVESGGSGSSKRDVANIGMGEDDGRGMIDDEESDEEKDYMDNVDEVDEPPAI
ncbi:hypothetical protein DFJ58DRAFT_743737 [Suillus subalutaceus]|uniref:uncharacterized protein n=1 Tax=Suillus subalutaceus TaxID=48586 RepID=UPI001B8708B5|nr:uncharacterized protein DFJ58DRAFT_743737 [Suillus subalutaceus]KAG1863540.1 hypothetical protein DFJ58DRAFT_743737 [Suillus subalutaceus]